MNDDRDTIRRVLAADVESFRRLVERYQRPLLTLIRNLTPPDTDREGVAQDSIRCCDASLTRVVFPEIWATTVFAIRALSRSFWTTRGGRTLAPPAVNG
jgi:hypothetical protein